MPKKPVLPKAGQHLIGEGGFCRLCLRTGAELNTPCPGFQTAGEYVDWTRKRSQTAAKKGKRK